MEGRPKRTVAKPSLYQTTSSDESPKRRKIPPKTITAGDIDKDIGHLRRILENPDNSTDMDETFNNNIYYTQEHTDTHPHIPTHTQSQTNIQSHTSTVTSLTSRPHSFTNIQSHTSTVTSLTSRPHSFTNIQPYTSTITPLTSRPHTSTNIQPYTSTLTSLTSHPHTSTNIQPYTSTLTSLTSHPHTYTNIQPYTSTLTSLTSHPHTYTNIQPAYTSTVTSYPHTSTNIQPYTSTITPFTSHPHTSIHADIDTSHSIHTLPAHSSMINTNNTIRTNNSHQFQTNLRTWSTQENSQINDEYQVARAEIPRFTTIMQEKLSSIDAELRRMNGLLHNVLRCVQSNNDRDRVPRKPACLPISSVVEMDTFQAIDDDDYREVVNYFKYIGGFNLKEAVNLCMKEGLENSVTPSFTWWGREEDQRPLYNTRFIIAIFEAVSSNRYFDKPTRSEFQRQIREALRTAKERCRSRARMRRIRRTGNHRRDFWSDDVQEEIREEIHEERADE
ncbi:unnamed protein product [Lasius platythorax]|uniref:DUF4806 domain-containing protein n=1 Tax=Lasius platythorax TaxID=488582 RepID=A0AAV2N091_9HYME